MPPLRRSVRLSGLQRGQGAAAAPDVVDAETAYARTIEQPYVDTGALEQVAQRVAGVYGCRVRRRAGLACPDHVRVIADRARSTAVAKDIQSAWFALWGLYVPRQAFSVTAVQREDDWAPRRVRVQLREVRADRVAGDVRVEVTLAVRGRRVRGHAASPEADADPRRLAASAALEAATRFLPAGCEPGLLDIRRLRVGGVPALVCALGAVGRPPLLGICAAAGDDRVAAARAVLDALNRLLRA